MKIADDTPHRSIEAVMWDIFEEENAAMFRLDTIGTDPKYLRNRIQAAFNAGITKGEERAAGRK